MVSAASSKGDGPLASDSGRNCCEAWLRYPFRTHQHSEIYIMGEGTAGRSGAERKARKGRKRAPGQDGMHPYHRIFRYDWIYVRDLSIDFGLHHPIPRTCLTNDLRSRRKDGGQTAPGEVVVVCGWRASTYVPYWGVSVPRSSETYMYRYDRLGHFGMVVLRRDQRVVSEYKSYPYSSVKPGGGVYRQKTCTTDLHPASRPRRESHGNASCKVWLCISLRPCQLTGLDWHDGRDLQSVQLRDPF